MWRRNSFLRHHSPLTHHPSPLWDDPETTRLWLLHETTNHNKTMMTRNSIILLWYLHPIRFRKPSTTRTSTNTTTTPWPRVPLSNPTPICVNACYAGSCTSPHHHLITISTTIILMTVLANSTSEMVAALWPSPPTFHSAGHGNKPGLGGVGEWKRTKVQP